MIIWLKRIFKYIECCNIFINQYVIKDKYKRIGTLLQKNRNCLMRILQPFRKSTTKKSEFQKNNTSETFVKNNTTW